MLDPLVQLQIDNGDNQTRIKAIERDLAKSTENVLRMQDRQEIRICELERELQALQLTCVVTVSDVTGINRLKWVIFAALCTQVVNLVIPYIPHPMAGLVPPPVVKEIR